MRGVKGGKAAGLACLSRIVMLPALSDTVFRRLPFVTEKGPGENAFFGLLFVLVLFLNW